MSKAFHLNRDRHCEERKRGSNLGNAARPTAPGSLRFGRDDGASLIALYSRGNTSIRRNAERPKRSNERARRDKAPYAAVSSANGGFNKQQRLASRFPRALHRHPRRLGAANRRLRRPQPRRRQDGGGSLHEPLAGGQTALADRRHADRNQGHH